MTKLELNASIDSEGKFTLHNRLRFEQWCQENKGKNIRVTFERKRKKRSLLQNNYYHGVVVQEIRLGLLNVGYEMSTEEVHSFLKQKFNCIEISSAYGEVMEVPGSTTELTTIGFIEYIERIARWASEYLAVVIPLPNENLKLKL